MITELLPQEVKEEAIACKTKRRRNAKQRMTMRRRLKLWWHAGVHFSFDPHRFRAQGRPSFLSPRLTLNAAWRRLKTLRWTSTSLAHMAGQLWNPSLRPNVINEAKSYAVLT